MTDVRNLARDLKTRKKEIYAELSPHIGGQETDRSYPFGTGFELFSASLVVGYMENSGALIGEEAEKRFGDGNDQQSVGIDDPEINDDVVFDSEENSPNDADDQYHRFRTIQEVLDTNQDHGFTIELIDRIIAIELASHSEDEDQEIPDDVWNLVVAHADKGVEEIQRQWKSKGKIELDNYFDELEGFWAEKFETISSDLTQIPTRENDGRIQTGD